MSKLEQEYQKMMKRLNTPNALKYIKAANDLVLRMADKNMNTNQLTERIYEITEPPTEE
jgi:hypothetical protein